jgi:hypothetical protein
MESVVRGGENGEFVHVSHINGLCANKWCFQWLSHNFEDLISSQYPDY